MHHFQNNAPFSEQSMTVTTCPYRKSNPDVSRVAKMTLAALIGVWIGLAAAAAGAGWLRELLGSHSAEVVVLMPLMLV
jgi:hypothetical protein